MRYSNTQIEAIPNFVRLSYNKPKRSTFSEHTVKNNKKLLPKKILDAVIENVIIIDKKKSEKEIFLVSYLEEIFDHIMQIQILKKQQNFGIIQDEPRSQTNQKINSDHEQCTFQSKLSSIQSPEVVQIVSKRLTFLNRTSNPFKMLPTKVTDQEDDKINQLREQYLKALEIARIKKLKKNRSTIINRSSMIAVPKKMTSFITPNILTQAQSQDKNKQQQKKQQLLVVKVNKPRIASYCEIKQEQIPIVKHQSQYISSSNKQEYISLKNKISKSGTRAYQHSPQQLKQNKLKYHQKRMSEIPQSKKMSLIIIPNTLNDLPIDNKQDRPKSKRVTQNDKDLSNLQLLIQNKRASLPQNALKICVQNRLKAKQQTDILAKQIQKKTEYSKSSSSGQIRKQNSKPKRPKNNITYKPSNVISSSNSRHIINKTKNYTLQSQHISQSNSISISSSIRESLTSPAINQIKSKFGTGKDPQSKHQIIQLLQALTSPHTVNLQKAYSPIPLRLQKIRKYINNSSKHKR